MQRFSFRSRETLTLSNMTESEHSYQPLFKLYSFSSCTLWTGRNCLKKTENVSQLVSQSKMLTVHSKLLMIYSTASVKTQNL